MSTSGIFNKDLIDNENKKIEVKMIEFYKLHDYCSPPFSRIEEALIAQNKSEKDLLIYI